MIVLVLVKEHSLMRTFFHLFVVRHEECSLIGFLTLLNRMINMKIRINSVFHHKGNKELSRARFFSVIFQTDFLWQKERFISEKLISIKSNGCHDAPPAFSVPPTLFVVNVHQPSTNCKTNSGCA